MFVFALSDIYFIGRTVSATYSSLYKIVGGTYGPAALTPPAVKLNTFGGYITNPSLASGAWQLNIRSQIISLMAPHSANTVFFRLNLESEHTKR